MEINKKSLLFLLLIILGVNYNSFSQKEDFEVIVIEEDGGEKNNNFSAKSVFVIKTNPVSFITSWQFVEIEKALTPLLSLQLGGGITFGLNKYSGFGHVLFEEIFADEVVYPNKPFRKNRIGTVFSFSSKFYFDEESPDGTYVSFASTYSNRLTKAQKVVENRWNKFRRIENEYENENFRTLAISGRYGYQHLHSTLVNEYFIGVGLQIRNYTYQKIVRGKAGYLNGVATAKSYGILLEFGVRLGFQI